MQQQIVDIQFFFVRMRQQIVLFFILFIMKFEEQQLLDAYLGECYEFRNNVLSGKYEMREREDNPKPFRPVTRESLNSIALHIKRDGIEVSNLKTAIEEYIYSEDTVAFNPIREYLESLPAWDGQDRVRELWQRIPGLSEQQVEWCCRWHRSMVAHWLQMDRLHANEQVVTLIGAQGCGKTTFMLRLLPEPFLPYFLDHINFGNKFDKEMALTHNLLVNIDELDQIKPSQQAELKQTLSKMQVNGRPIFGRNQELRERFSSFCATTNNRQPLSDVTGSRRFICCEVADGMLIDNDSPIDHAQLYAQLLHELRVQKLPYWFNNDEVMLIEAHNEPYRHTSDLETLVNLCFRKPHKDEAVTPVVVRSMLDVMASQYKGVPLGRGVEVRLGKLLRSLNFKCKPTKVGTAYYVVPRQAV